MLKDWDACAREVGRALSRYDGQTTNVMGGLETILSVPASPLFDKNPSCPALTLSSEMETRGVGKRSAEAGLSHGISLGFLSRAVPGSPKTAKIALSPLGRAYRAALQRDDAQFQSFLVAGAVLDRDFDMYGLFLKCALENEQGKADKSDFREKVRSLQQQRRDWLHAHVLSPVARDSIRAHIQWMAPGQGARAHASYPNFRVQRMSASRELTDKSINDHFNMRRQWAKHLSHVGAEESLTGEGRSIAFRVRSVVGPNSMFWLAPTLECVRKIGGVAEIPERILSGWDLLRPDSSESEADDEMIRRIAEFMLESFSAIRLRIFKQAPLSAVIPFVHFQEMLLGQRVNLRDTFDAVMKRHRGVFHCLLSSVPAECHYQVHPRHITPSAKN